MSGENNSDSQEPKLEISDNKVVSFHFRLCKVGSDGKHSEWLEESFDRQPHKYLHGFHNVIVGVEKALLGKSIGDCVNITLSPEDAYGLWHPNIIQRVPIKYTNISPRQKKLAPPKKVSVQTDQGLKQATVVKMGKFNVDVDFNHPYAGMTLYYEIEVVEIRDATAAELDHGHVHGDGGYIH